MGKKKFYINEGGKIKVPHFYNMNAYSGYTYSASLPVTWAKTTSGFTVYLPNDKTFDYVAICLI